MKPLSVPSQASPAPFLAVAGGPATLVEVFAATATDGAATGLVLAHLRPGGTVLWVQDRASRREGGRPCLAGIGGGLHVLHLEVARAKDALWTAEEGLGCAALAAVVAEVWGEPPALDLVASRRLALRAEAGGVSALLVRRAAWPCLSAARRRWRVRAMPARQGAALWDVELFRARGAAPGRWSVRWDRAGHRLVPEGGPAEEAPEAAPAAPGVVAAAAPAEGTARGARA